MNTTTNLVSENTNEAARAAGMPGATNGGAAGAGAGAGSSTSTGAAGANGAAAAMTAQQETAGGTPALHTAAAESGTGGSPVVRAADAGMAKGAALATGDVAKGGVGGDDAGGVNGGSFRTGEPPVPLFAAASAAGNATGAKGKGKVARFARRKAWVGRAALVAAALGVGVGAEAWNEGAEAWLDSGMGGSPMLRAADFVLTEGSIEGGDAGGVNGEGFRMGGSGMGGSPMRGVRDSGMGGSPMRGVRERISLANGETWAWANGDAGWGKVAVSGMSQTHGRAAHATKAATSTAGTVRKTRWWEGTRAQAADATDATQITNTDSIEGALASLSASSAPETNIALASLSASSSLGAISVPNAASIEGAFSWSSNNLFYSPAEVTYFRRVWDATPTPSGYWLDTSWTSSSEFAGGNGDLYVLRGGTTDDSRTITIPAGTIVHLDGSQQAMLNGTNATAVTGAGGIGDYGQRGGVVKNPAGLYVGGRSYNADTGETNKDNAMTGANDATQSTKWTIAGGILDTGDQQPDGHYAIWVARGDYIFNNGSNRNTEVNLNIKSTLIGGGNIILQHAGNNQTGLLMKGDASQFNGTILRTDGGRFVGFTGSVSIGEALIWSVVNNNFVDLDKYTVLGATFHGVGSRDFYMSNNFVALTGDGYYSGVFRKPNALNDIITTNAPFAFGGSGGTIFVRSGALGTGTATLNAATIQFFDKDPYTGLPTGATIGGNISLSNNASYIKVGTTGLDWVKGSPADYGMEDTPENRAKIYPKSFTYSDSKGTPETVTFTGLLSGGNALRKIGAGTLILTGTNTYAGGTDIQAGTLAFTQPGGIGGNNLLIIRGGTTLSFRGTGTYINTNTTQYQFGDLTYMGTGNASKYGTIDVSEPTGRVELSLGASNYSSIRKTGAGTLVFNGATDNSSTNLMVEGGTVIMAKTGAASYSVGARASEAGGSGDGLIIKDGLVRMQGKLQIYPNTGILMEGGIFDLNGVTSPDNAGMVAFLRGSGGVVTNNSANSASSVIFWINSAHDNWKLATVFAGTLADGASGAKLALTVGHDSTPRADLTLTGNNTYTGSTTVTGASAKLAMLGGFASDVYIRNGAEFRTGPNTVASGIAKIAGLSAGSTLVYGGGSIGDFTFDSGANFVLGSEFVPDSPASIILGTQKNKVGNFNGDGKTLNMDLTRIFSLASGGGSISVPLFTYETGTAPTFATNVAGGAALRSPLTVVSETNAANVKAIYVKSSSSFYQLTFTGAGGTTWDAASAANWTDAPATTDGITTFRTGDSVIFPAGYEGTKNIALAAELFPAKVTVSGTGWEFSGSGKISGSSTRLVTEGAGTSLTISNANTYGGGTTVGAGTTLVSKNLNALGVAGSLITLENGATLKMDSALGKLEGIPSYKLTVAEGHTATLDTSALPHSSNFPITLVNPEGGHAGTLDLIRYAAGSASNFQSGSGGFDGTIRVNGQGTFEFNGTSRDYSYTTFSFGAETAVSTGVNGGANGRPDGTAIRFTASGTANAFPVYALKNLRDGAVSFWEGKIDIRSGEISTDPAAPGSITVLRGESGATLTSSSRELTFNVADASQRIDLSLAANKLDANVAIVKTGEGTLRLTTPQTFDAPLIIKEGVFEIAVNASTLRAPVIVESGAKFLHGGQSYTGFNENFSITVKSGGEYHFTSQDTFGSWGGDITFTTTIEKGGLFENDGFNVNNLGPVILSGGELRQGMLAGSWATGTHRNLALLSTVTVKQDAADALLGIETVSTIYCEGDSVHYISLGHTSKGGNPASVNFDVEANARLDVNAVLGNRANAYTNAGNLIKSGAGTMTLFRGNSFTGGITVNGGVLDLRQNNVLTAITIDGGTLTTAAINGNGASPLGATATSQTGASGTLRKMEFGPSGGTFRYTGTESAGETSKLRFNITGAGTATIDIANAAARVDTEYVTTSLVKTGAGVLYLGGADTVGSMTGTGSLVVGAGAVVVSQEIKATGGITVAAGAGLYMNGNAVKNRILDTATLTLVGAGSKLDLRGRDETLGVLNGGAGAIVTNSATVNLSATGTGAVAGLDASRGNNADATLGVSSGAFAGAIEDGVRKMGLAKTGGGTLTLSGANTYTGLTAVSGGTLGIAPGGSLGATSVSVGGGARLLVQGELSSGASVDVGGGTGIAEYSGGGHGGSILLTSGILHVNGSAETNVESLTFNGATSILRFGENGLLHTGAIATVGAPTLQLEVGELLPKILAARDSGEIIYTLIKSDTAWTGATAPNFTMAGIENMRPDALGIGQGGDGNKDLVLTLGDLYLNLRWDNTGHDSLVWKTQDTAKNFLRENNASKRENFYYGDAVLFNSGVDAGAAITLSGDVQPSKVTVLGGGWSFTGTGRITGATALEKGGAGALTISTANTYTGGTTIGAGSTIIAKNKTALGAAGSLITLGDGATLKFDAGSLGAADMKYKLTVPEGATALWDLSGVPKDSTLGATFVPPATGKAGTLDISGNTSGNTLYFRTGNGGFDGTVRVNGGGYFEFGDVNFRDYSNTTFSFGATTVASSSSANTGTVIRFKASATADVFSVYALKDLRQGAVNIATSTLNVRSGEISTVADGTAPLYITGDRLTSSSGTLTVTNNNTAQSLDIYSQIWDIGSIPVTFVKEGAGRIWTNQSFANITGGIVVNEGLLYLNHGNQLNFANCRVTINDGGTLHMDGNDGLGSSHNTPAVGTVQITVNPGGTIRATQNNDASVVILNGGNMVQAGQGWGNNDNTGLTDGLGWELKAFGGKAYGLLRVTANDPVTGSPTGSPENPVVSRIYAINGNFTMALQGNGSTDQGGEFNVAANAKLQVDIRVRNAQEGASQLIKSGLGVMVLTNAQNSFSGRVTVKEGTLEFTNPAALGTLGKLIHIEAGAKLTYSGTGTYANTNTGAFYFAVAADDLDRGDASKYAEVNVSNPAGRVELVTAFTRSSRIYKTGAGTLVLGGNADNNTVGAIVDGGTLILAKTNGTAVASQTTAFGLIIRSGMVQLADLNRNQIYLNTAVRIDGGVLDLNGNAQTISRLSSTDGFTGGIVTNSNASKLATLTVGQSNVSDTYHGIFADGAAAGAVLAVSKTGTGTQTLTGSSTHTGLTSISDGVLALAGAGSLANSVVTIANTGTAWLDISGLTAAGGSYTAGLVTPFGTSIQGLTGNGRAAGSVVLGANTLQIGTHGEAGDSTFNGSIGYAGDTGGFVKEGTGTFTYAPTQAIRLLNYTGRTVVAQGTLAFSGSTFIQDTIAASSGYTFGEGANLSFSGITPTAQTFTIKDIASLPGATGGTLALGTHSLTVQNAAAGARLTGLTGTGGTFTLAGGTLTLAGATTHSGGTIAFANASTLVLESTVTLADNLTGTGWARFISTTGVNRLTGTNSHTGTILGAGATLEIAANALGGGLTLGDNSTLRWAPGAVFDPTDGGKVFSLPATGSVNLDTNGNNVIFGSGLVTAPGLFITKTGLGTLTLADTTNASGDWATTGGTLDFLGPLGAWDSDPEVNAHVFAGTLHSGFGAQTGTLRFSAPALAQRLDGKITGIGSLTKAGAGVLTLGKTADLSLFAGNINVTDGHLATEAPLGALDEPSGEYRFHGVLNVTGTGGTVTFRLENGVNQTLAGGVSFATGTAGIIKDDKTPASDLADKSVLTLSASAIVAAPVDVRSGTLVNNASLTSPVTVAAGAALAGTGRVADAAFAPGALLSAGSLPVYSTDPEKPGPTYAPLPSGSLPESLTIEPTGGSIDLDGVTLRVSLRATESAPLAPSEVLASYVKVVGAASYGTSLPARVDISAYGELGTLLGSGWIDGTHTILTATGGLTTDSDLLDATTFLYKNVEVRPSDRFTASFAQVGSDLVLTTIMAGNLALSWNDMDESSLLAPQPWNDSGENLNWEKGDSLPQKFVKGDAVTFGGDASLAKFVSVPSAGGGLVVGALNIDSGEYTFLTTPSGAATPAKLAGVGALGGVGIAKNLLHVGGAETARAVFNLDVDFGRVEITAGSEAVFNGQFVSTAPGGTLENSGLVLGAGASVAFTGTVDTTLPVRAGAGASVLFDNTDGNLSTAKLAGVALDTGAFVELAGDGLVFAAPITGVAGDGGVRKTGAGEVTLTAAGASTYRGATRVLEGTLALGAAGAVAASAGITVEDSATLRLDFSEKSTLAPAISGGGALLVTGDATLSKINTHTGGTLVSGADARLELAAAGALNAATEVRVRDGGTLTATATGAIPTANASVGGAGATLALNAQNALASGATVEVLAGGNLTLGAAQTLGVLQLRAGAATDFGGNNLTLLGVTAPGGAVAGTLAAGITNAGTVTLGGGALAPTLQLTGANALAGAQSVVVKSTATLQPSAAQTFASLSLEQGGSYAGGAMAITVGSGEISGVLVAGGLTKNTEGTLTLWSPVFITGDAVATGGTLILKTVNALPQVARLIVESGASLLTEESQTVPMLTLAHAADSAVNVADFGGSALTITGSATLAANSGIIARTAANLRAFTLGGSGFAPKMSLDAADALASAETVTLRDGALEAFYAPQHINELDARAASSVLLTHAAFTVASGQFSGSLSGTADSAFIKDGEGILVFEPSSVASFLGTTTIRSGTLAYDGDARLGAGARILDGATAMLRLDGAAYSAAWTLGAGGGTLLSTGSVAWGGAFSGTGALAFGTIEPDGLGGLPPEPAAFTLGAASVHTGETTLLRGSSLHLEAANALAVSAGVRVLSDSTLSADSPQHFNRLDIAARSSFAFDAGALAPEERALSVSAGTIAGTITGAQNLVKGTAGLLAFTNLTAAQPLSLGGALTVTGGTLSVPLDAAGPTVRVDELVFSPDAVLDITGLYDGTGDASDPPQFTLIKTVRPIAIGSFPTNYIVAGSTSQNFVTVQIERGVADRDVVVTSNLAWYDPHLADGIFDRAHGSFDVATTFNLGHLLADRPEAVEVFGQWDGRALTKTGAGTLTLSALNTYTGSTTVRDGTLVIAGLLGSLPGPLGETPKGRYVGAVSVEMAGTLVFDTPWAQELAGTVGGGSFHEDGSVAMPGGLIVARGAVGLLVSGEVSHAGSFTVERTSRATFTANAAVGGQFTATGRALFTGQETRLAALEVTLGGTAEFAPAEAPVAPLLAEAVEAPPPVIAFGFANVAGTLILRADASVAQPIAVTGEASRLEIAGGTTLNLARGGFLETAPAGTGWTIRSGAGSPEAVLEAREGIAGNLLLEGGAADIRGDIGGAASVAEGTRLDVSASIRGHLVNRGTANVRGILHGGADNHPGALLELDNIRNRIEVRGEFRNSGTVNFAREEAVLRVAQLRNLPASETGGSVVPGYYNLALDAATPALSSHIEVATGGSVTGQHRFNITDIANIEAISPGTTFELIRPELPGENPIDRDAEILLTQPIDIGLTKYDVLGLGNAVVRAVGTSDKTKGILGAVASQSTSWFNQLDAVSKRFGELRLESPHAPGTPASEAAVEHFWVRAHALRANASLPGLTEFSEDQYGGEVGVDHAVSLPAASTLHLGAFAGYQHARRNHKDTFGARSTTDSPALGAYATYVHPLGFYADGVAMARYSTNEFRVRDTEGLSTGDYDNTSLGLSLEAGWTFSHRTGWSVSPAAHLAYTAAYGASFDTSDGIHTRVTDGHTIRWGLSLTLARTFTLQSGSRLQPYLRATYDEQDTYGANVTSVKGENQRHWNPRADGGRLGLAAGFSWQLTSNQLVHLEYETGWGKVYDTPWSLNAGWRLRF